MSAVAKACFKNSKPCRKYFLNLKIRVQKLFLKIFVHFFFYTIFDPNAKKIHHIHKSDLCMYIKIELS